jgi:hypothetical protein
VGREPWREPGGLVEDIHRANEQIEHGH